MAILIAALMIGLSLSSPTDYQAKSMVLGPWSAPAQVSTTSEVSLIDSSQEVLYAYRWGEMIYSPDNGATWSSAIEGYGTYEAEGYVLYRANFSDVYPYLDVFFSKSYDNGATWTGYSHVMTHDGGSDGAYRICKFGSIFVFYAYVNAGGEGWINYSRSTDEGVTWTPQACVDTYVHVEDPVGADIVLCGGKLFLAYYHYEVDPIEFNDVVVIESDDMGATWTNRQVVGSGYLPLIKEDSGKIYVTYWNYVTETHLMFTMSVDLGTTWTTPIEIANVSGYTDASNFHSLAVHGSQIFAAYLDYDPGGAREYTVHINYSDDGGNSWNDMGDVDGLDTNSKIPSLLISNGKLHFMFVDAGQVIGTNVSMMYRWLFLDSFIPEFSTVLMPIVASAAILITLFGKRRCR
jgi:BNR repeat-like domain